MSNFFAALDDSDNEGKAPVPAPAKKKSAPKKPEVVEPSKVDKRAPKGDRNTKGGRSERPPARDGKRTHDRRSGTGRGKEIKKGGGGGRNWGSDQNDAKKAEGPVTEGKEAVNTPEAEAEATVEKTEGEKKAVEEKEPEPEEEEEEDNTMSYEEYLAQKARPDSVAFKPVSEREIDNEFAGKAAAAKKKEVESDFLVMAGGKQPKKKGKGKKEKETLILDFKVKSAISTDERREGGRREGGGRGGREGGGRGGGRREGGGGRGEGGDRRREGGGGRGGDRRREGGGGRGGGGDRGGQREQRTRTSGGGGGGGGKKGLDTTDASAFPSL